MFVCMLRREIALKFHRPDPKHAHASHCFLQMARKDMHFDNSRDTLKTPGDYQTAAEFWKVREERTITIQRYWRGFSARSKVWLLRKEKWAQAEREMEETAAVEREKARRQEREMQRRMNPRTAQDFEVNE